MSATASVDAYETSGGSPPALPLYLTAAQVAELLQLDETTITRWALEDATMPVFKRGRVVRFPRVPLLAWLARHERPKRSSRAADHAPITHGAGERAQVPAAVGERT